MRRFTTAWPSPATPSSIAYHACTGCGDDDCYLEYNHLFEFNGMEIIIPLCINCHMIINDDQHDHPEYTRNAKTLQEAVALLLFNLADLSRLMLAKQRNLTIVVELIIMLIREFPVLGMQLFAAKKTTCARG